MDFTPTSIKDLYNLSFGDLLPDGSLDDTTPSNNGDIVKVLSTVMQITKEYTDQHPHLKLVFSASTDERTRLYARILKLYHEDFRKDFIITGFLLSDDPFIEIGFEPKEAFRNCAFFIKRNN